MTVQAETAAFEALPNERARILGALDFATVGALLSAGRDAILGGRAAVIDLAGVTHSDSSGLALLVEWLSIARGAQRSLRYENVPVQIRQLSVLSEVEGLFAAS